MCYQGVWGAGGETSNKHPSGKYQIRLRAKMSMNQGDMVNDESYFMLVTQSVSFKGGSL